ncbi:enoyl-CoA hydratase/isomerase family protein [Novosphingobium mangrovi (ex Huang et al. 2023)]|uniref:Enoyl-CoA hydratase/isomerase family protein n=1 Tax=Novosphingobium mangrovi (ex Huang et al. 2023) TaxID=2976432 RepID=A0ABT2I0N0_9SPHN|nr:enoyl-CoA hydratase/isomerase family protein [Novosphingobium mangrovi (ex Huang et al. 2023)]MCT2398362.1 enoyl-CoA hydratase/isomerase family protein [Novosphingobium mangrovi (ex Huang et al. 2023)]
MSGGPTVLVERQGAIAQVTLNRPERRNGVTVAMCFAFHEAVSRIAGSDARVLVLRGAGDDFCVGADIAASPEENAPPTEPGTATPGDMGAIYHASTLLHTMPQVTIAAIDGGCAGAGMGWATACDLRFATARARFSTAFLNVGVSGDMGLAWNLARLVGGAKARELLFFPDRFDGRDALAVGLVNRLYEPDVLHARTRALAEQLAARDPLALRLMKANCVSAETLPMGDYIEVESGRHLQTTNRPELRRLMAEGYAHRKGS